VNFVWTQKLGVVVAYCSRVLAAKILGSIDYTCTESAMNEVYAHLGVNGDL